MRLKYLRPAAGIIVVLALFFACRFFDLSTLTSLQEMRTRVDGAGALGPFLFIAVCIAGVILHLPEIVLIAIGGVLFGGLKGFFYGWAGSLLGSACTFLLVRTFLRRTFQSSVEGRFAFLQNLDDRLARRGFQTVLVLRLLLFMAPPLNWLIALSRVRFPHYLAGSMAGIIPGVAITCSAADAVVQVQSAADLMRLEFAVPAALLAVLVSCSGTAAWRLFKKEGCRQE